MQEKPLSHTKSVYGNFSTISTKTRPSPSPPETSENILTQLPHKRLPVRQSHHRPTTARMIERGGLNLPQNHPMTIVGVQQTSDTLGFRPPIDVSTASLAGVPDVLTTRLDRFPDPPGLRDGHKVADARFLASNAHKLVTWRLLHTYNHNLPKAMGKEAKIYFKSIDKTSQQSNINWTNTEKKLRQQQETRMVRKQWTRGFICERALTYGLDVLNAVHAASHTTGLPERQLLRAVDEYANVSLRNSVNTTSASLVSCKEWFALAKMLLEDGDDLALGTLLSVENGSFTSLANQQRMEGELQAVVRQTTDRYFRALEYDERHCPSWCRCCHHRRNSIRLPSCGNRKIFWQLSLREMGNVDGISELTAEILRAGRARRAGGDDTFDDRVINVTELRIRRQREELVRRERSKTERVAMQREIGDSNMAMEQERDQTQGKRKQDRENTISPGDFEGIDLDS